MIKRCSKCGIEKDILEFTKDRQKRDGIRSTCKQCTNEWQRKNYQINPLPYNERNKENHLQYWSKPENREKSRITHAVWKRKYPHKAWAVRTLSAHKGKGCIIGIMSRELSDLAIKTLICEYCGKPLAWGINRGRGGVKLNSPSLDRTNNDKVMTLQNIKIVCWECNAGKGSSTLRQYVEHCKRVVHQAKTKGED